MLIICMEHVLCNFKLKTLCDRSVRVFQNLVTVLLEYLITVNQSALLSIKNWTLTTK